MKVLLVNGSPHREGCIYTALSEIAETLKLEGVEPQIFHIGTKPVHGCIACSRCRELGRCVFDDDPCNEIASLAAEADGIIIGSPVYFSGVNGALCAILDRAFYSARGTFAGKPGAAVVSCRRGGASSTFDRLNKYFTISQMPVVSSQYWNAVHGNTPEDVRKDLEGLQIMRTLAKNMVRLLKACAAVPLPEPEETRMTTNFIR